MAVGIEKVEGAGGVQSFQRTVKSATRRVPNVIFKVSPAGHQSFQVERSEKVRLINLGLRWRSEAKPCEKQARDGARRSEAKSSVGEEIEALVGTRGLIMENSGQGELERFRADSRLKRGFVGSILGTLAVFKGKGRF